MRKYPDQGQPLGQASAGNLVLSVCEQVKVTWSGEGLGFLPLSRERHGVQGQY